jgi:cobalt-zinc-cadmium efflux system membrane fusion protein
MKARLGIMLAAVLLLTSGGFLWLRTDADTRAAWWNRLLGRKDDAVAAEEPHQHAHAEQIQLSPQAVANLKLVVKPLRLDTYWRTLPVPGMVVERPGKSDRGVTTAIAGIVRGVKAVPGDMVRPGDELFTLRLISESLQTSQTELFKNAMELQITQDQKKRMEKSGIMPEARLLEFDYQLQRVGAGIRALRQDLAARGLTPEQIDAAAEGKFVREITVRVPESGENRRETEIPPVYEVEELKVQLGEQVLAGQVLCTLANHHALSIEGRAFKHEVPLIEQAAQHGWPVRTEIAEAAPSWAALDPRRILYLGNRVDPASQTVPVYLPLVNQFREHQGEGRVFRVWRFRPGQRVRLEVPVEQFTRVFVLPVEAVVRDGPEVYAFRQNGEAFDRKPVHVMYEDRRNVVIANDGSLFEGNVIAMNGASQLHRALKAKTAGGGEHGHDHHHHEH